jgi:hypothetical protein
MNYKLGIDSLYRFVDGLAANASKSDGEWKRSEHIANNNMKK